MLSKSQAYSTLYFFPKALIVRYIYMLLFYRDRKENKNALPAINIRNILFFTNEVAHDC